MTPEYNCDIQKINQYVVVLEEGLAARGEASQDTMMNVHEAYIVCKGTEFVRHAKDEYAKWEQGAAMTLWGYMESCLTKCKTLKMKGLWEEPRPEQEQSITLTAAVSSLKSKVSKYPRTKAPADTDKEAGRGPRKSDGSFAWKNTPPKSGDQKNKVVNGKTYYWCTHHKSPMWALHNPDSFPDLCPLHPKYSEMEAAFRNKSRSAGNADVDHTAGDMKLQGALAAIQDSDMEGDDE